MVEFDPGAAAQVGPEVRAMLALWQELCDPAQAGPPPADAMLSRVAETDRPYLARIVPGRRTGFVVETCGIALIRRFGRYAAGDRVSALAPGIREDLSRKLVLAARCGEAVVARSRVALGRVSVPYDEVILPLARAGAESLILLYARESWAPRLGPGPGLVAEWFASLEGRRSRS